MAAALVIVFGVFADVRDLRDVLDPADRQGASVQRWTIDSKLAGREAKVAAAIPEGASDGDRRPLLVFLHGRSGDEDSEMSDAMFGALKQQGADAPVVVFPDGGKDKYWHDREAGRWGSYVLEEVIPEALERLPVDPDRVALGGISMGGFGAYDLALATDRRLCAVGGHSPALWRSGGETAPGAFDDADDFARHDVIARAAELGEQPLWLDAGEEDPFDPGARALADAWKAAGVKATVRRPPGAHEGEYWNAQWGGYMRFYAQSCKRR